MTLRADALCRTLNLPAPLGMIVGFAEHTARRFLRDSCAQTAGALTYTTLLALVPLMTIGFSIFSAFPAYDELRTQAQQMLFESLIPEVGTSLLAYVTTFTANAGQLTAFGVVGLTVTSVLLFHTIEDSFSAIWRVRAPRSLVLRLLAFWAIITLSPLLLGASLSLTIRLRALLPSAGWLPGGGGGALLPGVIEWACVALVYLVIPNRSVRWRDAAAGAAAAASALEISKSWFVLYVSAFPTYQTIYGALSTVPIFLLWLYIAWCTVLFGAEVAAALPEWRGSGRANDAAGARPGAIALAALDLMLAAARDGAPASLRTLADRIPAAPVAVEAVLDQLESAGWATRTQRGAWVVVRDLGEATLNDLLRALGAGVDPDALAPGALAMPWLARAHALLQEADRSARDSLDVPLRDLLRREGDRPANLRPTRPLDHP